MDPLSEPGHTDLTANVDFSYLAEALSDVGSCQFFHFFLKSTDDFTRLATTHGPLPQADFLNSLGLLARLRGLLAKAPEERKSEIESAAKRLVDTMAMGKEYKVMAITPAVQGVEAECFPFEKNSGAKGTRTFNGHGI